MILWNHSLAIQKNNNKRNLSSASDNGNSKSQAACIALFKSIGDPCPFAMAIFVNPSLLGANQHWPGWTACREITVQGKKGNNSQGRDIVYASDSLTNPWNNKVWNEVVDQSRRMVGQVKSLPND